MGTPSAEACCALPCCAPLGGRRCRLPCRRGRSCRPCCHSSRRRAGGRTRGQGCTQWHAAWGARAGTGAAEGAAGGAAQGAAAGACFGVGCALFVCVHVLVLAYLLCVCLGLPNTCPICTQAGQAPRCAPTCTCCCRLRPYRQGGVLSGRRAELASAQRCMHWLQAGTARWGACIYGQGAAAAARQARSYQVTRGCRLQAACHPWPPLPLLASMTAGSTWAAMRHALSLGLCARPCLLHLASPLPRARPWFDSVCMFVHLFVCKRACPCAGGQGDAQKHACKHACLPLVMLVFMHVCARVCRRARRCPMTCWCRSWCWAWLRPRTTRRCLWRCAHAVQAAWPQLWLYVLCAWHKGCLPKHCVQECCRTCACTGMHALGASTCVCLAWACPAPIGALARLAPPLQPERQKLASSQLAHAHTHAGVRTYAHTHTQEIACECTLTHTCTRARAQVDPKPKLSKRSPKGAKNAPPPEEHPPVPQGFVVDGFPRTEAQVHICEGVCVLGLGGHMHVHCSGSSSGSRSSNMQSQTGSLAGAGSARTLSQMGGWCLACLLHGKARAGCVISMAACEQGGGLACQRQRQRQHQCQCCCSTRVCTGWGEGSGRASVEWV